MAKAEVVEYVCETRSVDACRGSRSSDEAFVALETVGERPIVALKFRGEILVFPKDRDQAARTLGNWFTFDQTQTVLRGARRVLREVQVPDQAVNDFLIYVDALKSCDEARAQLVSFLSDKPTGQPLVMAEDPF